MAVVWGGHCAGALAVSRPLQRTHKEEARPAFVRIGADVRPADAAAVNPREDGGTTTNDATEETEVMTEVSGGPEGTTDMAGDPTDEVQAKMDLDAMGDELQPIFVAYQEASWLENTDDTPEHSNASIEAAANLSSAYAAHWSAVIDFYDYENFTDAELRWRFELQATPGTAALDTDDQKMLTSDVNTMTSFSLEKVCPYENQDCDAASEGYSMDELENVLATNRDNDALVYYWTQWRDIAGKPTKPYFIDYVGLMNKAAEDEKNGFDDAGEMWLQPYRAPGYTTDQFKVDVDDLWNDMKELYEKLHAYVRYRLRDYYDDSFGENSPIPAHLLGNMWGQSWENIYDLVAPFPDTPLIDITETLQNNTDVETMFEYAENFFTSIGLYEMTFDYWNKSMFVAPTDAVAVCHASAWDFLSVTEEGPIKNGDFRIKMCTDLTQEDFITIHHEMGHTEYQMAYSQLSDNDTTEPPLIFRDGANPGFHEAIGDTIALSVSTPSHLEALQDHINSNSSIRGSNIFDGWSTSLEAEADSTTSAPGGSTYERDINQLMRMALEKVAFIPYAYILDKFRWDVFAGGYGAEVYNYEWWKLRVSVQGLKPPVLREKDSDFDPGCKYHVASNVPYIRYFVATILQFQFHEHLCEVGGITANDTIPVYQCDIYNNTVSGEALKNLLRPGRSLPWTDQLANFMAPEPGNMTSAAIRRYFAPLEEFLDEQISLHGLKRGWDDDVDNYFVQHIPPTVPIIVGVVLCVMIVIVVVAYFVGKNRNEKKNAEANSSVNTAPEPKTGQDNEGLEMDEKKSTSSNDS
jgi:peptidyl-dipeptidase A